MTQRTVYLASLVTVGTILISSVLQIRAARRVDAAELYAMRAARDYEFAALIQKTKELNQAALAILRNEPRVTCIQGEPENYTAFRFGTQVDRSDFRPSAPLPAIHRITDKPERASPQVD